MLDRLITIRRWRPVHALVALGMLLALFAGTAPGASAQTSGGSSSGTVYALTASNQLLGFDQGSPGQVSSSVAVTGLASGESLLGIDFRPATGGLYALGGTSQIYTIDPGTGVATAVGGPFTPGLDGATFGFDFNPTVDRIRVVSDTGQDLRINPDTGAVGTDPATGAATVDGQLAYASGDANAGAQPIVAGAAYTNSVAGATQTTLYDIDTALDVLVTQDPPNDGVLNTTGPLGFDAGALLGFDIAASGQALAAFQPGGAPSRLYAIDLSSGAGTDLGAIGGGEPVTALAISAGQQMQMPATGGVSLTLLAGGAALISTALAAGALSWRRGARYPGRGA